MKTYAVVIQATVVKTIRVEADNEDLAVEAAHALFSTENDLAIPEHYDEETVSVTEVQS